MSETGYYPFSKKEKEAQKIIEEHTSLQTEVVSRSFLKKLPGFRSNAPLNKYIGSICYTALIAFLLKWMISFQAPQIALYSISIGCMLLGLLCLTIGLIEPDYWRYFERTKKQERKYFTYIAT